MFESFVLSCLYCFVELRQLFFLILPSSFYLWFVLLFALINSCPCKESFCLFAVASIISDKIFSMSLQAVNEIKCT